MSEKGGVFYRNRVIITHRSVEQEKKVPRNQEVAPSFPIFHWQFVVLIKWSCCAPNFDIGLALMRTMMIGMMMGIGGWGLVINLCFWNGWVSVSEWVSNALPFLIYIQAISSRPGGLMGLLMITVMTIKVIRLGLRVCEARHTFDF